MLRRVPGWVAGVCGGHPLSWRSVPRLPARPGQQPAALSASLRHGPRLCGTPFAMQSRYLSRHTARAHHVRNVLGASCRCSACSISCMLKVQKHAELPCTMQELSPSRSHVLVRDASQRLYALRAAGAPADAHEPSAGAAGHAVLLAEGAAYAQWAPEADVIVAQCSGACLLWLDPGAGESVRLQAGPGQLVGLESSAVSPAGLALSQSLLAQLPAVTEPSRG